MAEAVILFPYVWYEPTLMSRIQFSGLGTNGAAFLYFDALNRQAMFEGSAKTKLLIRGYWKEEDHSSLNRFSIQNLRIDSITSWSTKSFN